jgi:hypothetical protein
MHLRLSDTTTVLPMVSMWPARPDRIAPVVSELSLRYRDTVRLQGLLNKLPELLADPARAGMANSERLHYMSSRFAQVTRDFEDVLRSRAKDLQFAEAVAAFQARLVREATGNALDSLYLDLPPRIRDFVELAYGSLNRPQVRLFEKMLYQAPFFDTSQQSLRIFAKEHDCEYAPVRPSDPSEISWQLPLGDKRIDRLFSTGREPIDAGELVELLGLASTSDPRLSRYFSAAAADQLQPWGEDRVRVRYFGHACVLLEWKGTTVLVDPLIASDTLAPGPPRFSFKDLPASIDYVLITHGHADHCDIASMLRLRARTRCLLVPASSGELGDPSLKILAEELGFENVVAMDCLDGVRAPGLEIIALPFLGEHGDLAQGKATWLVRIGNESVLFAADSKAVNSGIFAKVKQIVGRIGTVFIGTCCQGDPVAHHYSHLLAWTGDGAADGRFTDGSTAEQAWSLLRSVGANSVYVYALGLEQWNAGLLGSPPPVFITEASLLVNKARAAGFTAARTLCGCDAFLLS